MLASPYRGLDPYTDSAEDASLFFGREPELEVACANLLAARLTLLYGPSGVGKSSMLRAGVVHRLALGGEGDAPRRAIVVMDDWVGDPVEELRRRARVAAAGQESGIEYLVVLDQFEEYLNGQARGRFDDFLPELVDGLGVPVRLLISLREDALAALDRFKGSVPSLFDNYLRLDRLDRAAALSAITGPVDRYNELAPEVVALEDGLAEEVVRQLAEDDVSIVQRGPELGRAAPDRVEPAHLQLVMQRLWDAETGAGSRTLRLATLAELGGAARIVRSHLRTAMDALPATEQRLAFGMLNYLVTPSGAKVRHTAYDLAGYVGAPEPRVRSLLERLAEPGLRLLRAAAAPAGAGAPVAYELYHDVLAGAELDWRTDYQARERRRLEIRNRRLVAALIAVSAAAIGLVLYFAEPSALRRAELATIDERMGLRPGPAVDPRLVVVGIDDATVEAHGGALPLPRSLHGRVLDRINRDAPRAIVYDVIFQGRGARGPADDRRLIAAIRRARPRLVLSAFDFRVERDGVRIELFGRPGFVEAAGIRTGYSGLPDDPGRVLRRVDYEVTPSPATRVPTLALQGARIATGRPLRPQDLPSFERRRWRAQSERTTWIDYHGPDGTIPSIPFADVLDGRLPDGYFRDKLVVVGTTASGQDRHRTPDGGLMNGPEIQANALETVRRGAPLRDVPRWVDAIVIVALALVPAAALTLRRPLARVAVIALAALALVAGAVLLIIGGRILAVVVPLVALAAGTIGVALAALARVAARRARAPVPAPSPARKES